MDHADLAEAIAQRDLARDAAVALEQELAHVTASRDLAWRVLRDIADAALPADPEPDTEPVDEWGPGVVIPADWDDPVERVVDVDLVEHMRCVCGKPELLDITHGTAGCHGPEQDGLFA